jgi:starch synthase
VAIAGSLEPYLEAGDLGNTLEVFTQLEAGFVFLGKENERVLQAFKKFTSTFRNRLGIIADGGPGEVHRALGAADILLVPSILDPLPFAHLYAQKYGTIPVVSQRFGSTQGIDPFERHHRKGNGFVFSGESACSMLGKLITAINAVRYDDHQESLIENGMNRRYSWKETQAGVEKIMKYLHRH